MDERVVLRGRPRGGVAIVWNAEMNAKVTPIDSESQHVCAVLIEYNSNKVLLICVYMPVDDNRPNQNIIEYNYVFNDIKTICNSVDAQQVIIGGDLNTDLVRDHYCTCALNQFVENENLL